MLPHLLVVLFEKALGIGKRGEAGVEYRKVLLPDSQPLSVRFPAGPAGD